MQIVYGTQTQTTVTVASDEEFRTEWLENLDTQNGAIKHLETYSPDGLVRSVLFYAAESEFHTTTGPVPTSDPLAEVRAELEEIEKESYPLMVDFVAHNDLTVRSIVDWWII